MNSVLVKAVALSFARAFVGVFVPLAAGAFESVDFSESLWIAAACAGIAAGLRAAQAAFTNAEPTDEHVNNG